MNSVLPREFDDFIAQNADRLAVIRSYLQARGVTTNIISLEGKNHIFVRFPQSSYSPMFKLKTVICHYDRVEGSPGANDNSAACFQIMDWACRLNAFRGVHNVRIFFTDGEELGGHASVKEQGSYALATLYRRLGITKDDVYVFDSCGRGDIAVMSDRQISQKMNGNFARLYSDLCDRTENLLRSVCPNQWFSLPMPYSDNASFLVCGIPAVVITMLPRSEVEMYARSLMTGKDDNFPPTWKMFHSKYDCKANLTKESFAVMSRLLDTLALSRTMA